ncbi:MAG: hypothetical protein KA480_06535 [Anaerolineales bacterium]|nr:hypothetical protein [Anaerolineales bacterium]
MARIILNMKPEEKSALLFLAEMEFRDPRDQAALIIRQELQRQGLLELVKPIIAPESPAVADDFLESVPRLR